MHVALDSAGQEQAASNGCPCFTGCRWLCVWFNCGCQEINQPQTELILRGVRSHTDRTLFANKILVDRSAQWVGNRAISSYVKEVRLELKSPQASTVRLVEDMIRVRTGANTHTYGLVAIP